MIVIGILSPLRMIVMTAVNLYRDPQVAADYGARWPILQTAEWVIAAASILPCWFMAWRLIYVHVRRTVAIAIAGIWMLAIGGQLVELLAVSLIAGVPLDALTAEIFPHLVRPLGFGLIWTAYFLLSKRVANTYVRQPAEAEFGEVFR